MMKNLNTEQWSLHFDGKRLNENEYQVAALKKRTNGSEISCTVLERWKGRNYYL